LILVADSNPRQSSRDSLGSAHAPECAHPAGRRSGDADRVRARGDEGGSRVTLGFHQRKPHAPGGQLRLSPTSPGERQSISDHLSEAPRRRGGSAVSFLPGVREARRTRYLGSTGHVDWLASFAPLGPAELRAFVPGVASPTELDGELTEELGGGIATALGLYADLGFESFNMALYGAPVGTPDYPLNLRMMCRSNPEPLYRSDATWLERLHWEAAVDISPERLAEEAAGRFGR